MTVNLCVLDIFGKPHIVYNFDVKHRKDIVESLEVQMVSVVGPHS